ncbi:MAG: cation transporter [Chloroflexi bacterium]|nr:cation transporter [Chloroflexota bacterium]
MFSTKSGAAKLALGCILGMVGLKITFTVLTGSISILAQAVDSFLDVLAVGLAFFAVVIALKPADEEHPFGHGKTENIAAVVQSLLLFIAATMIAYSAILRIISGEPVRRTEVGIGVMIVSISVSFFLSRHLLRVSHATDSIALEAIARNIAADVYSAAGVLGAMTVIYFTRLNIIDPLVALLIAALIARSGYKMMRKSFGVLIDVRLPEEEEEIIRQTLMEHTGEFAGFHGMRTRKAGSQRFIDLHLVMRRDISVEEAHHMCDHLEEDLKGKLKDVSVTIHVEPCDSSDCEQCRVSGCSFRANIIRSIKG